MAREMSSDVDEQMRLRPLSDEPNLPDLLEANFRVMSNRVFPSGSGLPFRHESCDSRGRERMSISVCLAAH